MKNIIEYFKFTKVTTAIEIEEKLLSIPDYSSNYYSIKRMNCNSYFEAAETIYNYLQNN